MLPLPKQSSLVTFDKTSLLPLKPNLWILQMTGAVAYFTVESFYKFSSAVYVNISKLYKGLRNIIWTLLKFSHNVYGILVKKYFEFSSPVDQLSSNIKLLNWICRRTQLMLVPWKKAQLSPLYLSPFFKLQLPKYVCTYFLVFLYNAQNIYLFFQWSRSGIISGWIILGWLFLI